MKMYEKLCKKLFYDCQTVKDQFFILLLLKIYKRAYRKRKGELMNTTYLNFGDFLQKKRMERQLTLRKMAELLGFSAPYLTDIEKDRRNPPEM